MTETVGADSPVLPKDQAELLGNLPKTLHLPQSRARISAPMQRWMTLSAQLERLGLLRRAIENTGNRQMTIVATLTEAGAVAYRKHHDAVAEALRDRARHLHKQADAHARAAADPRHGPRSGAPISETGA